MSRVYGQADGSLMPRGKGRRGLTAKQCDEIAAMWLKMAGEDVVNAERQVAFLPYGLSEWYQGQAQALFAAAGKVTHSDMSWVDGGNAVYVCMAFASLSRAARAWEAATQVTCSRCGFTGAPHLGWLGSLGVPFVCPACQEVQATA